MASQTVAHAHGHVLVYNIHRLYFTMTGLAKDAGAHVRPVIEEHIIRQFVNSHPWDRCAGGVDGRKLLDAGAVDFRHFMAVHAFIDRWDTGHPRFQHTRVTVLTRDL